MCQPSSDNLTCEYVQRNDIWYVIILKQMDGLMKSNDLVFLLAATNLPWELDAAMLRRLEKRVSSSIYIF